MKYKNIKSLSHNFTHSFVSWENRVDDCVVIEYLKEVARSLSDERLVITWIPSKSSSEYGFPQSVITSIERYLEWLPELAVSHDIELACISELRTEIYRKQNHQLPVESVAIDDRGQEYRSSVDF
ncbi:hypothetical protein [Geomonas oryzae]|uniref:hypothetical protein n=1 Tax=Geomonas oryzae TaxID=2364273 RepID=UPI00100A8538|nr:hypothetical protein [Geomonas oryzae]